MPRRFEQEVTLDIGSRYHGIAYGLDVTGLVVLDEMHGGLQAWSVEGHAMPLTSIPTGLAETLIQMAIEEADWTFDEIEVPR